MATPSAGASLIDGGLWLAEWICAGRVRSTLAPQAPIRRNRKEPWPMLPWHPSIYLPRHAVQFVTFTLSSGA